MKNRFAIVTLGVSWALFASSAATPEQDEAPAIRSWLSGYDAAFVVRDLDKLATFYHPEVTIYAGGGINRGWADYRDHHLGPRWSISSVAAGSVELVSTGRSAGERQTSAIVASPESSPTGQASSARSVASIAEPDMAKTE
jgi:hypothetical protein